MKSFKEYLLEVKKKKGTVVGQQYGPPDNLISVDDIIRKVGNQKRSNTQNVSKLISINKDLENDEGILHKLLKEPSKDFINRTNRANMSFPILVTTKGDIVDGSHRLAKAYFSNKKKIKTITVPDSILRNDKNLKEDLRDWFSKSDPDGDWKRINSKGEVAGPCAREEGEPKPKCMSKKKRASLTKKERAAAVRAKRRHDPDADRSGSPINVSNYGKGKISEEILQEKNIPTSPEKWSHAKSLARSKFKVYPSAYANGWAAKKYKAMGGGWETE